MNEQNKKNVVIIGRDRRTFGRPVIIDCTVLDLSQKVLGLSELMWHISYQRRTNIKSMFMMQDSFLRPQSHI